MIDLQPFCSRDTSRADFATPFSLLAFTYFTNGHLAIRVPRREDVTRPAPVFVASCKKTLEDWFTEAQAVVGEMVPPPMGPLPPWPPAPERCTTCGGMGEAECPHCKQDMECDECGGSGEITRSKHPYVEVLRGVILSSVYFGQIRALPGMRMNNFQQLPITARKGQPLYFTFDGGDGILLPILHGKPDLSFCRQDDAT